MSISREGSSASAASSSSPPLHSQMKRVRLLTVLRVRHKVESAAEPETLRTRGPAGYAGPGSLGGTESALRR